MKRLAIIFLLLLMPPAAAWAAPTASAPIYNPKSKSYFQLFRDNRRGTWDAAQLLARSKIYKGVKGRLAVVDSQETHQFVISHFDLKDRWVGAWIGLRYWCPVNMLQWEGQRLYSPSEPGRFSAWHTPWHRYEEFCVGVRTRKHGYMPVYYRTINGITRWQAVDLGKGFLEYIVEYPTGGE